MPVQVRLAIALTSEQYISQQAWRGASLARCPFGQQPCHAIGHGSYERKRPAGMRVARRWCKPCGVSIGLLPDFISSRISGTLEQFEQVARAVDEASSQWEAAEQLRPHEGAFESALKWVRFRAHRVRELLQTVVGLVPELLECEPRLEAIADRLGLETGRVLSRLRVRCEPHLESLAAPLGLLPRPFARKERKRRHPQSAGPDPPPADE